MEQYIDFVLNRMFRETLFVHAERAQEIRYNPDGSRFRRVHIAAFVPPTEEQTRLDNSRQEYRQADGSTLFTNDPGIKAALDALSDRWPWTQSRQELVDEVHARLVAAGFNPSASLPDHIDSLMGVLILQGQARCRLDPVLPDAPPTPLRLDETARRMAELTRNRIDASTFNLWHETQLLSPLDRHVLPLLDGTRDHDALVAALLAIAREEPIAFEHDGLAEYLDALPQHLAEMKLLRVS
jgi:methyltransferase-like protein